MSSRALAAMKVRGISQYFLAIPRLHFLVKGMMQPFVPLMFWLYTVLQYQNSMSSNFLVLYTSGAISSIPVAFLFFYFS